MPLLRAKDNELTEIKEKPFHRERELQRLTEANLGRLFGLVFVSSEFERDGLRIDTLAYDPEAHSFTIIEYKKNESFSVVDQGFAYLSLMLNNKEVFLVEHNERCNGKLRREDIDWSQSKVMFMARSFTDYQQAALGFKDVPIELWKVTKYEGDIVLYDQMKTRKSSAKITTLRPGSQAQQVATEVKTYSEADAVPADGKTRALYDELKERVMKLDAALTVRAAKSYIGFKMPDNWRNIFTVYFRPNKLRIHLMRSEVDDLNDPEAKVTYVKDSMKHFNQHICAFEIGESREIDYAVYLLQQAVERFKEARGLQGSVTASSA